VAYLQRYLGGSIKIAHRVYELVSSNMSLIFLLKSLRSKITVVLPLSARIKRISELFLMKLLQDFVKSFIFWFIKLLGEDKDGRLLMVRMNLFLSSVSISNLLVFNWYQKPMFSGRYLNYFSQHPFSQKRDTIMGMINRALLLSHPRFQQENLHFKINILLNNDLIYPLKFIFDTINT